MDSAHLRRRFLQVLPGLVSAIRFPGGAGAVALEARGEDNSGYRSRADEAFRIRRDAALFHRDQPPMRAMDNGDERLYWTRIGNYSKALPHNGLGEVDPAAYSVFLNALQTAQMADFEVIPLGGRAKLANPQAAYCFDLAGDDSHEHSFLAPPAFNSAEAAGEMVELYWQALTRDIPFSLYGAESRTSDAVADLNRMSAFSGPRQAGQVTPGTLFRGSTSGDLNGPYVSQFLWKDIPYGAGVIVQKYRTPRANVDYLISYSDWFSIQNGDPARGSIALDDMPRYIRSARDLTWYVHQDFSYQAYLNACNLLLSTGASGFSEMNPYSASKTQSGFATFGAPNVLDWVGNFANAGLRAAWCAKWLIHRRLRPEEFGGRIHNVMTGAAKYPIHGDVLNSTAVKATFALNGSHLLSSAYAEGCPAHPSYPAGHAVIAGACVTALKAFFNEGVVIANPVVASDDGQSLLPYNSSVLTVGDELNKLAANIAIARNAAGVHYRSDGTQGLLLGENVAMGLLHDIATTYSETFSGFSFTKFDGTQITICPKCQRGV